ncbi:sulfurtransferase TusA family protein [Clostridium collagenovorans]|uniref:sulfurtransferase TusA family protein n=1 Tax=Clostridium collagenovorans TaxID=29357 RepID=UPI001FA8AC0C|nr:sulfurtransferase TusA family protein [Clostridium collagenovorans]
MLKLKQIDTRGMSCPQPLLMTKNALKDSVKEIEVVVDCGAPKSNVTRFLNNSGFKVTSTEIEDGCILKATK